jgi:hypothetical protein
MKKVLCMLLVGVLSLSVIGCGKKEQKTDEVNTQDITVEAGVSDGSDTTADVAEIPEINPQMGDREVDSSLQIGNTVLEMPITYADIVGVPDIEMFTDEDRTITVTDTFLVEADADKEIYCSIYGTNFTIKMKNINESDLNLNECMITDIEDIDGPGIVLPGNIQFGITDLRTLKNIYGDEIMESDGGWHIYAGKTHPYNNPMGEDELLPITGNKYNFMIDESSQLVNGIWWEVNDWTQTEQVMKIESSDTTFPDISITVEDGWNPYCDMPDKYIYQLFKSSTGNEYLLIFDLTDSFSTDEIGRNDIDSSEFVKYKTGTEFDYAITKVDGNYFDIGLYNDTASYTGYYVEVQHVNGITDNKIIKDIDKPSDIDEIANHLMDVLKTAQTLSK